MWTWPVTLAVFAGCVYLANKINRKIETRDRSYQMARWKEGIEE